MRWLPGSWGHRVAQRMGRKDPIIQAKNNNGYLCTTLSLPGHRRGKAFFVHRLAWFIVYGSWAKYLDHINRDKLDNRILNLREADHTKNMHNRPGQRGSSSKYRGVSSSVDGKKWRVRITPPGRKPIQIGKFDSEELAASAYNKQAKIFFGEFACLNEIPNE